jgi:iron complex transport system ATP-binding protein
MSSLEAVGLAFRYPAGRGLRGVAFAAPAGAILGVVGPNSAGKSTLLRLLSKVLTPQAGRILLDGWDVARLSRLQLARQVAVVPQEFAVAFPFSVGEVVLMGRYPHAPTGVWSRRDRSRAEAALARLDLTPLAHRRVDELSGGERQLVSLARALAQETTVLLLDEPTAHLDLRHQRTVLEVLQAERSAGRTLILVSHDLNLASEHCDELLLLADGTAQACGRPEEVMTSDALERAYGCPVEVERSPATGRPRLAGGLTASRGDPAAHSDPRM